MRYALVLALLAQAMPYPGPTTPGGGGPSYALVQSCNGDNFGVTSLNCAFGSNVTSGHELYIVYGSATAGTLTITTSGVGCPSFTQSDSTLTANSNNFQHAWGNVTMTGSCTVVANSSVSGSMDVIGVEISGSSSGTIDQHNLTSSGNIVSSSPISGTAVTTTVNNDYILSSFQASSFSGDTFTAGSGTILVQATSFGLAIQGQLQTTAGSIAPTATSNDTDIFAVGYLALKP